VRNKDDVAEEREVRYEDHLQTVVGLAGDEERSFVRRYSEAEGLRTGGRRQRIQAHQSWFVSESNQNSVGAQAVDVLVVESQRIKISSILIGTEAFRCGPRWSRGRQVELCESTGRHCEVDEQSVADDDHCRGVNVARS
jgi:hypothetical protein